VLVRIDPVSGAQSLIASGGIGANVWGLAIVAPEPTAGTGVILLGALLLRRRQGAARDS
jgi:hypothetical protein